MVEWVELKVSSNRGGIIILWDKRQWSSIDAHQGQPTMSAMMEGVQTDFRFCFTCVYGTHTNWERDDFWNELAGVRGLWNESWVIGRDFNVG